MQRINAPTHSNHTGLPCADIIFKDTDAEKAWIIDLLSGRERELIVTRRGLDTVIESIKVRDYPVLVHICERI